MKKLLSSLLVLSLGVPLLFAAEPKRVVVVTVTTGFRHSSIPFAEKTLQKLADESKAFTIVEFVRQPDVQVPRKPNPPRALPPNADDKAKARYENDLKKYDAELAKWTPEVEAAAKAAQTKFDTEVKAALSALDPKQLEAKKIDGVIFANTTGDLPLPDNDGFVSWVKAGHAFIGTHSASDTFHGFAGYKELIQAEFKTHGRQVPADLVAADTAHPANGGIGAKWDVAQEEVYEFRDGSHDREKLRALWYLRHHPQDPAATGYNAVSWVRKDGNGRIFYTSLGHREDLWSDDPALPGRVNSVETSKQYQAHLLGGIKWALGLAEGSAEPNPQATADLGGDFKPLFNGKDFAGWHVRKPEAHNAWAVKDGVLTNELKPGEHGVDLITDAKYWNFVVRYEYKVPDGSNSGFYLRGRHEIQILGDFAKKEAVKTGNGAIYNHTAPSQFVSKPGNEWQTVEATVIGNKITVVLNGVKIHDNLVVDTATGSELDKNVTEPGSFFLQGDHGAVSFRNLFVKELPKE